MENEVFLSELKKILESDKAISFEDQLHGFENFDSLTQMSLAAWISDVCNIDCKISDISNFQTVNDIYNFIK